MVVQRLPMPVTIRATSGLYAVTRRWWYDRSRTLMVDTDGGESVQLDAVIRELGDDNLDVGGVPIQEVLNRLHIDAGHVCLIM